MIFMFLKQYKPNRVYLQLQFEAKVTSNEGYKCVLLLFGPIQTSSFFCDHF